MKKTARLPKKTTQTTIKTVRLEPKTKKKHVINTVKKHALKHSKMEQHEHTQAHNHTHIGSAHIGAQANEKVVLIGFLLTFSYMVIEFVGGYLSGSLALMADAGHMLIDAGALALAWAGFYFGRKAVTTQKTFGYVRLEVLAALLNSVLLFGLTGWVTYEAVLRFYQPTHIMALPMFTVAVVGLIVNCLVFYILNRGEKDHLNIKGAILHVLGDLLGSVAAIVAAIIIYFTGWTPIDSILSILVCVLILKNVWQLFKGAFNILMEGTPADVDVQKIQNYLMKLPNVKSVCHIHVWALTSGKTVATLNICPKDEKKLLQTVQLVEEELAEHFNICHVTVGINTCPCALEQKGAKHVHD